MLPSDTVIEPLSTVMQWRSAARASMAYAKRRPKTSTSSRLKCEGSTLDRAVDCLVACGPNSKPAVVQGKTSLISRYEVCVEVGLNIPFTIRKGKVLYVEIATEQIMQDVRRRLCCVGPILEIEELADGRRSITMSSKNMRFAEPTPSDLTH